MRLHFSMVAVAYDLDRKARLGWSGGSIVSGIRKTVNISLIWVTIGNYLTELVTSTAF